MTAENQRENVRIAAKALAPITEGNQLVISHGMDHKLDFLHYNLPPTKKLRRTLSMCLVHRLRG